MYDPNEAVTWDIETHQMAPLSNLGCLKVESRNNDDVAPYISKM